MLPLATMPSRRLLHLYFSSAGHVVNKTRSALDADTVNMLVCVGLVPLTLMFQFSIHIINLELTGDPFKLNKLYNLKFSSLNKNNY